MSQAVESSRVYERKGMSRGGLRLMAVVPLGVSLLFISCRSLPPSRVPSPTLVVQKGQTNRPPVESWSL